MDRQLRRKSIAFSATVVLISSALLIGGLVGANGVLAPAREGKDWWQERALTHHTISVSVHAGALVGSDVVELAGIWVAVQRVPTLGSIEEVMAAPPVESEPLWLQTDGDGRAVFEVAAEGMFPLFRVSATWNGSTSEEEFFLEEDTRIRVYFDDAGEGYWRWVAHRDLKAGGEKASLVVDVLDLRTCEFAEEGGVRRPTTCTSSGLPGVDVYRVRGGERAELVATEPEGPVSDEPPYNVRIDLDLGVYDVVVSYEGREVVERLFFACDWDRLHQFDGTDLVLEAQESCGGWRSGGEPSSLGP